MLAFPRPPKIAYSRTRTPLWSNTIQKHTSGGLAGFAFWSQPLWNWVLDFELLRDGFRKGVSWDERKQVEGLFNACVGNLTPFSFWDVDDNRVFRQSVGTTDGISTAYTLTLTRGSFNPNDGYQWTENVGLVDLNPQNLVQGQNPFNLYVDSGTTPYQPGNSDPTWGYTLATAAPMQQQIVFNGAPPSGHKLYVDMSYLFFARFSDAQIDFEKFQFGLWRLKKCNLESLRFGAGGSSLTSSTSQAPGRSITVTSSPLQLTNTDGYVGITNNSGGALEIDLPLYPSANQVVKLADEGGNAGTYNWTVKFNGTAVPNGTVIVNSGFISLRWNGTAWYQIGAQ